MLEAERREVRRALEEFFSRLRDEDPVAYGEVEVERAIEFGAVETVLLATDVSRERRAEIEERVSERGGDAYVVATETDRGARFAEAFGGVGAVLRSP